MICSSLLFFGLLRALGAGRLLGRRFARRCHAGGGGGGGGPFARHRARRARWVARRIGARPDQEPELYAVLADLEDAFRDAHGGGRRPRQCPRRSVRRGSTRPPRRAPSTGSTAAPRARQGRAPHRPPAGPRRARPRSENASRRSSRGSRAAAASAATGPRAAGPTAARRRPEAARDRPGPPRGRATRAQGGRTRDAASMAPREVDGGGPARADVVAASAIVSVSTRTPPSWARVKKSSPRAPARRSSSAASGGVGRHASVSCRGSSSREPRPWRGRGRAAFVRVPDPS